MAEPIKSLLEIDLTAAQAKLTQAGTQQRRVESDAATLEILTRARVRRLTSEIEKTRNLAEFTLSQIGTRLRRALKTGVRTGGLLLAGMVISDVEAGPFTPLFRTGTAVAFGAAFGGVPGAIGGGAAELLGELIAFTKNLFQRQAKGEEELQKLRDHLFAIEKEVAAADARKAEELEDDLVGIRAETIEFGRELQYETWQGMPGATPIPGQ